MTRSKKPLKRSIILGGILFIILLSLVLSFATYREYRESLYERYEAYITDTLTFVASNIDTDDLKACLDAGTKSEKFQALQALFDQVKDTHKIDFLYVIIPVHPGEGDNMMNVIAAMSTYEKEHLPENEVELGELTGDSYPADTARKYYNAMTSDDIVFFEEVAEWGDDYTGILNLRTSDGEFFAELCVDVPIQEIHDTIRNHMIVNVALIVVLGILLVVILIIWSTKVIIAPIEKLESSVVGFASQEHGHELTMKPLNIHTGNEIESLANAVEKMAGEIQVYVREIVAAEREAERSRNVADKMQELANKDALTGVRNKTAYDRYLKQLTGDFAKGDDKFGFIMIDLNYLKRINDTYGHEKGDLALKKLCGIICEVFKHSPVFRVGGDEFVVVLRGSDYEESEAHIEHFQQIISALSGDETLAPWQRTSAAIGCALYDKRQDTGVTDVFRRADAAMYEMKKVMKIER